MRAAYANGVLAAFEDAGRKDSDAPSARPMESEALHFDAVYGTSAGGALAAWFSAGQARFALSTWDYVADRRILSYRRWASGRGPLLDHDKMFAIIYEAERPLDTAAVQRAPWPVYVTVTDADSGAVEYHDIRKGPVLAWLRATGRLPLAAGDPVEIDGRRWLDGGIVDPIPVRRAIADGAKEVVVILNRPRGERKKEPPVSSWLVGKRYPHLRSHVDAHHQHHNDAVRLAENPPPGVHIEIIRPARDTGVRRFTRDMKPLRRAMAMGEADGRAWLAGETGIPVELGRR